MAGRFPLYTDADIHGPVVEALRRAGWDVLRAVDAHPEATTDPVHFEHAAKDGRVLVSNDRRLEGFARTWLEQGKPFRGMICWPRAHYARMTAGDFLEAFEELARQDDPFVYPMRPLTLAQVHSALAYYFDHPEEIDRYFEESEQAAAELEAERAAYLKQRPDA